MFSVRFEDHKIKAVQKALGEARGKLPVVMSRALNRTATKARTDTTKMLASETALQQKFVRPRIVIRKATRRFWASRVDISRKRIPLMAFRARQNKEGVTVKERASGRTLYKHAFIAVMPTGHKGVFKRSEKSRLPIKEQYGPSLAQVFTTAQARANQIYIASMRLLEKNVNDQIRVILNRKIPA